MQKPKVLKVTEYGHNLVECPVCKMPYLEHGLNNHLSKMAGKEAQYEMARVIYLTMQRGKTEFALGVPETFDNCPHWKYLVDNPKVMPDVTPVRQKERYKR